MRTFKDISEVPLPDGISEEVDEKTYRSWLKSRAKGLCARDRRSGVVSDTLKTINYFGPIHRAVERAIKEGDFYTGEKIAWGKLGTLKSGNKRIGDYPSVDHVAQRKPREGEAPPEAVPAVVICCEDTNKMKTDLSIESLRFKVTKMRKRGIRSTADALRKAETSDGAGMPGVVP